jgi:hypothetical protein
MLRRIIVCVGIVFIGVFHACDSTSGPEQTAHEGGSGSEIIGTARYGEDAAALLKKSARTLRRTALPVPSGKVFVYPRTYLVPLETINTPAAPKVYTDTDGRFRVSGLSAGSYIVEITDSKGTGVAREVDVPKDSVVDIGTLLCRKTAAVVMHIDIGLPGDILYYAGLRGTRIRVRGTQNDIDLVVDDIPTGIKHTVSIKVEKPAALEYDIENISVAPGARVRLDTVSLF